jgi:membrane protein DedA with SNARE-associated domain
MAESILGVFALAIIELWAAIPLGFHLQLQPAVLALAAIAGAFTGATAAMFVGGGIRRLFFWRKGESGEGGRMSAWLTRKGPWAIGLLGPLLIGPVFAALLAGALKLPRRSSMALLAAGIVFWTIVVTLLAAFGVAALR